MSGLELSLAEMCPLSFLRLPFKIKTHYRTIARPEIRIPEYLYLPNHACHFKKIQQMKINMIRTRASGKESKTRLFFLLTLLMFVEIASGQEIYTEYFDLIADGATVDTGTHGWTTRVNAGNPPSTFSKQFFVGGHAFMAQETNGLAADWVSDVLNISSINGGVTFTVDVRGNGNLRSSDFINFYYNTDGLGGKDHLLLSLSGSLPVDNQWNAYTVATGLTGNNIQFVIEVINGAGLRTQIHYFRDIKIESTLGGNTLFSTANGDWNNPNSWSLQGLGQATCNCKPDQTSPVVIGNNNIIDLSQVSRAQSVLIGSTGTIRYTTLEAELYIEGITDPSLTLVHGATIDQNNQFEADITFKNRGGLMLAPGSNFSIDRLFLSDIVNFTLDIPNSVAIPHLGLNSSSFSISNSAQVLIHSLDFRGSGSHVTNFGTATIGRISATLFSNISDTFINHVGGVLNIGDIDISRGTAFQLINQGTLNQTGNFLRTDGSILNDAGGSWSWTGTSYDSKTPNVVNLATAGNSFTYSGGDQHVIPIVYDRMQISGGGVKTVDGNTIVQTLDLNNGFLQLNSDTLTIDDTGIINGANSSSFIITNGSGSLIQSNIGPSGRSAVLFPVGATSTRYTPVTLSNTGSADDFSVRTFPHVYLNGTAGTTETRDGLDQTWVIEESQIGGSVCSLTFGWTDADERVGFTRQDAELSEYNSTTTSWSAVGAVDLLKPEVPYSGEVTGVTSLSLFSINNADYILPITLSYFTAAPTSNGVMLKWETLSELDNDYFTLEKSYDGIGWNELMTVKGAGNSAKPIQYRYLDNKINNHLVYYRLKQTDYDGTSSTSHIVSANLSKVATSRIFPTVATTWIQVRTSETGDFVFYNAEGKDISSQLETRKITDIEYEVFLNKIPAGSYFIRINDNIHRFTKR